METLEDRQMLSVAPASIAPLDDSTVDSAQYAPMSADATADEPIPLPLATDASRVILSSPSLTLTPMENSILVEVGYVPYAKEIEVSYTTSSTSTSGRLHTVTNTPGGTSFKILNCEPTTYYVRAYAKATGIFDKSATTLATAAPSNTTLTTPTLSVATTSTALVADVGYVPGASRIVVEYAKTPDFSDVQASSFSSGGGSKYTVSNLEPATTYYVRVHAESYKYGSSDMAYATASTMKSKLAVPEVEATADKTTIDLNISEVENAEKYLVRYSSNNFQTSFSKTFTSAGLKTLTQGLKADTVYDFRVTASASDAPTSDVLEFSVRTLPNELSGASISALAVDATHVEVTLGEVPGATGYVVEYATNSAFSDAVRVEFDSYGLQTISGLRPLTTYYLRACGTREGYADSEFATTSVVTPGDVSLDSPTLSAVSASTAVTLTIGEVEYATKYQLEYSRSEDFDESETTYVSAGEHTVEGLESKTTYFFRVRAVSDDFAPSDWTCVSATTLLPQLPTPTLSLSATPSAVVVQAIRTGKVGELILKFADNPEFDDAITIVEEGSIYHTFKNLDCDTTYYVSLCAVASDYTPSEYVYSTIDTKHAKLDTPVVATDAAQKTITLDIAEVEGAEKYYVRYSTNYFSSSFSTTLASAGVNTLSLGVKPDTVYQFRVVAKSSNAPDSDVAEFSVRTLPTKIYTPGASVEVVDSTTVELTIVEGWGAAEYVVERATDPEFSDAVGSVYDSCGVKTVSGLEPATKYYFRVRGAREGYNDSDSATTSVTTPIGVQLDPPVVATEPAYAGVLLNIEPVEHAQEYQVEYSTSPDFADCKRTTCAAGEFLVDSLKAETLYYLRVRAVADVYAPSEWTEVSETTLKKQIPAPELDAVATSTAIVVGAFSKIGATWSESYLNYKLDISTTPDFAEYRSVKYTHKIAVDHTFGNLESDTTYYFRVCASSPDYVTSEYSYISFTTKKATLTPPQVTLTPGVDSIELNIAEVPNAEKYYVRYSNSSFATSFTTVYDSAGVKTIEKLKSGEIYEFRITAMAEGYPTSAITEVWTKTLAELTPPYVYAAPIDAHSLSVEIGYVKGAKEYVLEYAKTPDFSDAETVVYTESGEMTIDNLEASTRYYVRVVAKAPDYLDSDSEVVCATTYSEDLRQLDVPVVTAAKTQSAIVLTIQPVKYANNYVVTYSERADFVNAKTKTFSAGVRTISNLKSGVTYYFCIWAVGQGYLDSEQLEMSVTTQKLALASPQVSVSNEGMGHEFVIGLGSVPGATKYVVKYSTDPNYKDPVTLTYTETGYHTVECLPPATYYIRVKAYDDTYLESAWTEKSVQVLSWTESRDYYDNLYAEEELEDAFDAIALAVLD